MPLGYHPSHGRLLDRERDVDVIFLGDFRLPRRRRILRLLEREGVDVLTLGDYSNPELWGEGRVELMNRVKVALNIPRLEGHLPDVRLVVAMANGALVVSEPLYLPEPYVPGVHYVEAPVDRLGGDDPPLPRGRRRQAADHRRGAPLRDDRADARAVVQPAARPGARGYAAGGVKDVRPDYYARLHAVEEQHWWHVGMREITAALLRERLVRGHVSLLDAGCGTGGFLAWATGQGSFDRLAGVDISAEAVELARDAVPGAELHVAPVHDLPVRGRELRRGRAQRRAPARGRG